MARDQEALDFYISYASQGQDRLWAEWIADQLQHAGYSVVLDVWSWLPGEDIILAREDALRRAGRVIAVCSAAYFSGGYTKQDWT
ncbi:MAG TPA: toll/interleukin-1 receptor domain-containing protein, partial [Trebonia sp.]